MKTIILSLVLAACLWFFIFFPGTAPYINFWLAMAFSTAILAGTAILNTRKKIASLYLFNPQYVFVGIVSAIALYIIFWLGNFLSRFIFSFAGSAISDIYRKKADTPLILIALFLLLWIGPAEEIFWRGFVQRRLSGYYGKVKGYVLASLLYSGMHIISLNLMLFLAALTCGFFWGWMFKKYKSLWPVIISHALWDVMVFVLLPLGK